MVYYILIVAIYFKLITRWEHARFVITTAQISICGVTGNCGWGGGCFRFIPRPRVSQVGSVSDRLTCGTLSVPGHAEGRKESQITEATVARGRPPPSTCGDCVGRRLPSPPPPLRRAAPADTREHRGTCRPGVWTHGGSSTTGTTIRRRLISIIY